LSHSRESQAHYVTSSDQLSTATRSPKLHDECRCTHLWVRASVYGVCIVVVDSIGPWEKSIRPNEIVRAMHRPTSRPV